MTVVKVETRPPVDLPVPSELVNPGMTVWDAGWSADRTYLALVTGIDKEDRWKATFSVYRVSAGKTEQLINQPGTLAISFSDPDLMFKDINGDKRPDFVYTTSTLGNCWSCTQRVVLLGNGSGGFDPARVAKQTPPVALVPSSVVDINNDGVFEWVMFDPRWELAAGFCHACSPGSWYVYAWNSTEYADASSRFAAYLDTRRKELQQVNRKTTDPATNDPIPPAASAPCSDKEEYLSALIGRYMDYADTQRTADAQRLASQMRSYDFGPLAAKRDYVVSVLPAPTTQIYRGGGC